MASATDPLLRRLGRTVQDQRKRQGWTLRELARRSALSERFLGEVERGRANPSVLRLAGIAGALGLQPEDLLRVPSAGVDAELGRHGIALLGLRGAGKSTVGAALGRRLGWPFLEIDEAVEKTLGMTLSEIFELHGQDYYRRAERDVLGKVLSDTEPKVLATGGGVVTEAESFALLKRRAHTVWLRARPEDHWERVVAQGDTRPMEGNERAFSHLCAILSEREKLYQQADVTVETSSRDVEGICDEVAVRLGVPS